MSAKKQPGPIFTIIRTHTPSVPGFVWVGVMGVLLFGVGVLIGLSYHTMFWRVIDAIFENMALAIRAPRLTQIMVGLTTFGFYGTVLLWFILLGWLAISREIRLLWMSLCWSVGGGLLGFGIKMIVSRMRPGEMALVVESSHSFPSLHAMNALLVFMAVAYLVYHFSRSMWKGYWAYLLGLALAVAIGFSRIYLGVHYFSDVVAGYVFAAGWFLVILFMEKMICLIGKKIDKSVKI